ncbi:hypothetical protein BD414DRAFT_181458 [Trametes punicea]|nr:hypothetical protein BD414DRAFT_181458 [Trametes punicea]
MRGVLGELDKAADVVPWSAPFTFLDIGCAPGGFSTYVLLKNKQASGVGISLPVSKGGHELALNAQLRERLHFIEEDILTYDLSPARRSSEPANGIQWPGKPLPEECTRRYHLVMLDGHALRTYPTSGVTPEETQLAHARYRDALLIGQFIIALTSVKRGGTLVVKLSHVECFPAAHLVHMLDSISCSLVLHKPRFAHTYRGTFYAIARGVGKGTAQLMAQRLEGLQALWHELRFGGQSSEGRYMVTTDLDFVVTAETLLNAHLDRLIQLSRSVWSTQVIGLREFFHKKGIAV